MTFWFSKAPDTRSHFIELSNERDIDVNNKAPNHFVSFKSQFVPNPVDNLFETMQRLDDLKIDPEYITQHIICDIVVTSLYLLCLICHICTLISLYNTQQTTLFALSLTLLIIGLSINIVWAFFYAFEIVSEIDNIYLKLISYFSIVLLSLPFGPLIFLFWAKIIESVNAHTKFINILMYCLGASFGQSMLMIIAIIMTEPNVYFIISLSSSILLMLSALMCISIENEEFTILKFMPLPTCSYLVNDSFILYCCCWIIDYVSILFVLIYSIYDSSNVILMLWFCNLFGVLLMSFMITYNEAKYFLENFSPSNMSSIFVWFVTAGIFTLYYIFFQIIVEMTCCVWIPVIYTYIKQHIISKYKMSDWHLVQWMVNRDKIHRLCIVNGLIMDRIHTYEKHLDVIDIQFVSQQQYISKNCGNNFKNVTLKGLKHIRNRKKFKDVMYNVFFGDDKFGRSTKFKMCVGIIFLVSRIIRFVVIPLVAAIIILPNIQSIGFYVIWIFIIQLLIICIIVSILTSLYNEIRYSLYVLGDKCEIIGNKLRDEIGFYYDAFPVYKLHNMLKMHFGSDIAHIIVAHLRET